MICGRRTVTELLKNLENQKMIQRISSKTDGRYKRIQFTEAAEEIRQELEQEIRRTESLLIKGISEADLETFCGWPACG